MPRLKNTQRGYSLRKASGQAYVWLNRTRAGVHGAIAWSEKQLAD